MKKSTLWKSYGMYNLKELEQYEKDAREMLIENGMEEEDITDNDITEEIWQDIDFSYDAEMDNLSKRLDGRIVAIADLGLWNGQRRGYKILSDNLNEVISFGMSCDEREVYFDRYNVKATGYHHDGSNSVLFRELKEDRNIDNFLQKIYNNETISNSTLNYYTKSLRPYIKEVYGC